MAEQNKQPQNNQKPEQDVNQLLKVRREKLAALQEARQGSLSDYQV